MTATLKAQGRLWLAKDQWNLTCSPHVAMQVKRIFPRTPHNAATFKFPHTPQSCFDLTWFAIRYPLDVHPRAELDRLAKLYEQGQQEWEGITSRSYKPKARRLALPLRHYQAQAVDLYESTGRGLLVGDDVGLGKTATAIGSLTTPGNLPAIVVTYAHLQRQWKGELEKFLPGIAAHIIQSRTVYDLRRPRPDKPATGKLPDVAILTYSKLAHWWQALAQYWKAKTVVWDECVTAESAVAMWPSGTKRVDSIVPGDVIAAFNSGGEIVADRVVRRIARGPRPVWRLTLSDGKMIRCTSNERIWTDRGWMYLQDMIDETSPGNTSGASNSALRFDAANGTRDAIGRRGHVVAIGANAPTVVLPARHKSGSILQTQSRSPSLLYSHPAANRSQWRMGVANCNGINSYCAGVRVFGIDLLSHSQWATDKSCNREVGGDAELGGNRLLVHGRWESDARCAIDVLNTRIPRGSSQNFIAPPEPTWGRCEIRGGNETRSDVLAYSPDFTSDKSAYRWDCLLCDRVDAIQDCRQSSSAQSIVRSLLGAVLTTNLSTQVLPGESVPAGPQQTLVGTEIVSIEFDGIEDVWDVETEAITV